MANPAAVTPSTVNPWRWWTASQIAQASGATVEAVTANWPLIAEALAARGIYLRDVCRGVIATVAIETGGQQRELRFTPVREAYWLPESWRQANLRYWPFYGRGFGQITWEDGYREAGQALGLDLLGHPDLALDPKVAAHVVAWFFATKTVPAKDGSRVWTVAQLCLERDWYWVRKRFQGGEDGLDRLREIVAALGDEELTQMPLVYNADTLPERQVQDWACSIRAATWVLKSVGVAIDAGTLQDEMTPQYVTPKDGLLDGKGYGLAEVLRRHLPPGTPVVVIPNASWEDITSRAGRGPGAAGLHGANHWINVARLKGEQLDAPNPAPNYPQEAPIGDQLTREEFDRWGPVSFVWVDVGGLAASADPRDAELATLREDVRKLRDVVGYLTGDVAAAIQREIDAIQGSLGAMQAAADTLKRQAA